MSAKATIPAGQENKHDVLQALRRELQHVQSNRLAGSPDLQLDLGPINHAFPQKAFPLAVVHEFVAVSREEAAAATGFLSGMLAAITGTTSSALWIATNDTLFAPALAMFDLAAHRIIRIRLAKPHDALWVIEEALKSGALAAVIGEIAALDLTASRRLQLAVEQSRTTAFLLRCTAQPLTATACTARWRVAPLPSAAPDGLPGLGFPRWRVELLKIRNGRPGAWNVQWRDGQFAVELPQQFPLSQRQSKTA